MPYSEFEISKIFKNKGELLIEVEKLARRYAQVKRCDTELYEMLEDIQDKCGEDAMYALEQVINSCSDSYELAGFITGFKAGLASRLFKVHH